MFKQIKLLLLVSVITTHAVAKPFEFEDYDGNDDNKLSRHERADLRRDLGTLGTDDRVVSVFFALDKLEREQGNPEQMSIDDLKQALFPDTLECDLSQRVFLRDSLRNIAFLDCPENREKSGGAAFSYSEDFEKGGSSGALKGVLGYVLIKPGKWSTSVEQRTRGDIFDDGALMAFAEVDGTLNSTGEHDGYVRFGIEAEAWTSGLFDQTVWDLVGYYQPNLNFDTHAVGVELRVTPFHALAYLNSYLKPPDSDRKFFFQVNGILDTFVVPDAANFGAGDKGEYLWLGGRLGAVYEDKAKALPNGFRLSVETLQFWDALHSKTANRYAADASFFLNETQTTSIGLEFATGRTRQSPRNREEQLKVNFRIRY
ncbi:hypothetical protein [Roseibium sp.]|uniref:hypothetical protein n=1 Tax=Roseibium sp. TaxID=1936156 RepID=UPI003A96E110